MRGPHLALTDTAVRNAKPKGKPYKLGDSQGLYLLINPNGSKLWRIKYRMKGVERKLALGGYPEISLAGARTARDVARKQMANEIDPNAAKRQARIEASIRAGNSFEVVANDLIAKKGREGRAEATLEKQRWLLQLLALDFRKRPVADVMRVGRGRSDTPAEAVARHIAGCQVERLSLAGHHAVEIRDGLVGQPPQFRRPVGAPGAHSSGPLDKPLPQHLVAECGFHQRGAGHLLVDMAQIIDREVRRQQKGR
jgi:hypothetical protein